MQTNALEQARSVERPTRDEQLMRAPSVQRFWADNRNLLQEAWSEWENNEAEGLGPDDSLYDPHLRAAVEQAWQNPSSEAAVKDLWEEVFPGVYKAQFFDPEQLRSFRDYLENVADAGIPLRPPYGISLNRGGAMLDSRSEGFLAAPQFQSFYQGLMNSYMRPISRLLFPDVMGYDTQTFGFSIQWQADKDTSLRAHTDASAVTLNINLNLPGEDFSGSGVRFFDRATRRVEELTFAPGTALIHHGSVPHESMPITEGERSNIVLWLYGDHGAIPPLGTDAKPVSPQERWTTPSIKNDGFAPF
ncbi:2OG-Fe(II) oxygenase [Cognatishimia activa]|uniref:2OG-Fe(II) oxygenase n=1 Tax=Cognatishimia activa TaxID=1715691 RepID=UPI0022304182|nr:2OG-Fe(II) oxygenase [Cognatishimia activa]UZD89985.1 2OG-Fe(II) oxygenase [Cognatishimia activa]